MPTPALSVRVSLSPTITTHRLFASLYAGDDCVSQTVHFRDMRQVRSYYNGVLAGLTLTNNVHYGDELILTTVGWPRRAAIVTVPVNPEYLLADGIDPMTDELV